MMVSRMLGAAAIVALTAGSAFAAPCSTGTTKGKTPDQTTNTKSSDVDKSSKNLAGGQQPGSPGTVGAMNNAGANQTAGREAPTSPGKTSNSTDPASKNLAGGQQPASPGTVGAMNNAAAARQTTDMGKDGC